MPRIVKQQRGRRNDEAVRVRALQDRRLEARIVRRVPLVYAEGPDEREDRPAFVRAASGVALIGGRIAVIQDDAGFLALCRPTGEARAIPLPRGPGGRRRFEESIGNRNDKLDLEACVVLPRPRGPRLVAFGSGSLPTRERILVFDPAASSPVRLVDGSALYASLRSDARFSGHELNVEGAAVVGRMLRLFQRGNGERPGTSPVPATVDLPLAGFVAWLDGRRSGPPAPRALHHYDLGAIDGTRFGFTDAAPLDGERVLFLASAERSPGALSDGEVLGSRAGWIAGRTARWTSLRDESGAPAPVKAEGIALDPARPGRAWLVVDFDDPDRPADLCEVRLRGPWTGQDPR